MANLLLFAVTVLAISSCLSLTFAEIIVDNSVQVVYDTTPKIHIRGSGFIAAAQDLLLDLTVNDRIPLIQEKQYRVASVDDGGGITIELVGSNRWADVSTEQLSVVALVLTGVRLTTDPDTNVLRHSAAIGRVVAVPSVEENLDLEISPMAPELRIGAHHLVGAGKVELQFNPPLQEGEDYTNITPVTSYLFDTYEVVLQLGQLRRWKSSNGPLYVTGINTGGGMVETNGRKGVLVATINDAISEPAEDTGRNPPPDRPGGGEGANGGGGTHDGPPNGGNDNRKNNEDGNHPGGTHRDRGGNGQEQGRNGEDDPQDVHRGSAHVFIIGFIIGLAVMGGYCHWKAPIRRFVSDNILLLRSSTSGRDTTVVDGSAPEFRRLPTADISGDGAVTSAHRVEMMPIEQSKSLGMAAQPPQPYDPSPTQFRASNTSTAQSTAQGADAPQLEQWRQKEEVV